MSSHLVQAAADSPAAFPSTAHHTPEAGMIQAPTWAVTCSNGNTPFPGPKAVEPQHSSPKTHLGSHLQRTLMLLGLILQLLAALQLGLQLCLPVCSGAGHHLLRQAQLALHLCHLSLPPLQQLLPPVGIRQDASDIAMQACHACGGATCLHGAALLQTPQQLTSACEGSTTIAHSCWLCRPMMRNPAEKYGPNTHCPHAAAQDID